MVHVVATCISEINKFMKQVLHRLDDSWLDDLLVIIDSHNDASLKLVTQREYIHTSVNTDYEFGIDILLSPQSAMFCSVNQIKHLIFAVMGKQLIIAYDA